MSKKKERERNKTLMNKPGQGGGRLICHGMLIKETVVVVV